MSCSPVARAPGSWSVTSRPTIGLVLDRQRNGFNLLRLLMASGVIIYHSFRLSGTPIMAAPLEQGLENMWVDGFFVLSGFLIAGSWQRSPAVATYLRNRLLRIYPGFVVCLVVTAFVLAPIGGRLGGGSFGPRDQVSYVVQNLGLLMRQYDIGGSPTHVPWVAAWDGSLWTLFWEFLCYLGVLVAGVVGLLRCRWGIPGLFGAAWLLQLATTVTPIGHAVIPLGLSRIATLGVGDASRFAISFVAGMLVFRLQQRLRCTWPLVAAALFVVLGSLWLPQYRLLGALPLAYALVAAGALMRGDRVVVRTDISYGVYIYAFPVQQIFAIVGLPRYGLLVYALAAFAGTAAIATASWFLVEKPALALKAR